MDGENGRGSLRRPFIAAANALATLYKQAAEAEGGARNDGARDAYKHLMQWAMSAARSGRPVTAQDVVNICAAELASMAKDEDNGVLRSNPQHTSSHAWDPRMKSYPVVQVRDDPLVSDIRKLDVNPRKRQRIDLSDTFMRACVTAIDENPQLSDSTNLPPSHEGERGLSLSERRNNSEVLTSGEMGEDSDIRDARPPSAHARGTAELFGSRKVRSSKVCISEKNRKK